MHPIWLERTERSHEHPKSEGTCKSSGNFSEKVDSTAQQQFTLSDEEVLVNLMLSRRTSFSNKKMERGAVAKSPTYAIGHTSRVYFSRITATVPGALRARRLGCKKRRGLHARTP